MRSTRSPRRPNRVASVDALRGFSMIWLLGGEGAALAFGKMLESDGTVLRAIGGFIIHQFEHAPWEGFRFWDLVFPLFIFVTGIAVVFSLSKARAPDADRRAAYLRIVSRAALLFFLGVLFYGGATERWPEVRLLGVLQRIALCYLFAALLFMHLGWRGVTVVIVVILVGYWVLLTYVPVPGLGGVATYQNDVNLANWIDRNFLPGKKYNGLTDPEGLLSTLPAITTCLLGVLAGIFLQTEFAPQRKAYAFMIAGLAMVIAGYLWGLQFPIIKAIWTSSFVLVTGGCSLILLGAFYLVMDIWGWQKWATVFKWIGANALALYFLNGVAGFEPFARRIAGGGISEFLNRLAAPGAGAFVTHVLALTVAIALAAYLYKRRIFIRV